MNRLKADREVKKSLIAGYGHYSREDERRMIDGILTGRLPVSVMYAGEYDLAEQRSRSVKNGFICAIAVVCRQAADLGADDTRCYALSDYYINEIEKAATGTDWLALAESVVEHYIALVAEGRGRRYTLPVHRAIRYVHRCLYEKCSLTAVAKAAQVHPNYLSSLFKAEVGISLSDYVRREKMEEAKKLLRDYDYAVAEIAELLGYADTSYFCRVFRQETGCSPRKYAMDPVG